MYIILRLPLPVTSLHPRSVRFPWRPCLSPKHLQAVGETTIFPRSGGVRRHRGRFLKQRVVRWRFARSRPYALKGFRVPVPTVP